MVDIIEFDAYSERWQIYVVYSGLEFPGLDFSVLNCWVTNVFDIIFLDLSYKVFSHFVVHNLHELLLLNSEASNHLMWFIQKFWNLVMETSEVSDHAFLVFEIFGPEGVIEETISNKYATCHNV